MSYKYASAGSVLAALLAVTAPQLPGQATTPAATPTSDKDEEPLTLSPFVIQASEDADSYTAKSTLAGTRIRTDLKDVGSAIQVITPKFLQDTGAKNSQDLLVYTTSTEVGGQSGNFVGAGNGAVVDTRMQRVQPQNNTRVRGLANADNTRDFFLTDIPWDSYNIGRVDLQRGPNSILFGIGSPAGIVNSSVNTAGFKDANTAEFRYGSFGTARESLDINKVILSNELAVRLSGLNDETKYRQDPAFQHDKRAFGALRYEPGFLAKGGNRTSFRFNYEKGSVVANRPRVTPPLDAITPWFDMGPNGMKKMTYDATAMGRRSDADVAANKTNGAVYPTTDSGAPNPNYQPWIDGGAGGQIFDQPVAVFPNQGSGMMSGFFEASQTTTGLPTGFPTPPWSVYRGIQPYNVWANKTNQPNQAFGVYKAKTISDPGLFDFYNKLIDGPNKQELQNFHALNAAVSQTFLNNKVGFDISYDSQSYTEENDQLIPNAWLTVDVMNTLPDGRANPNVGRAMVIGAPNANNGRHTEREAWRATAFGELNFKDMIGDSPLTHFLGRHVFTGLLAGQRAELESRNWYSYVASADYRTATALSLDSRRIPSLSYLGGNLSNVSMNSANIPNISGRQVIPTGTIRAFNTALKPNPANPFDIVGWQDIPLKVLNGYSGADRDVLYSDANKSRDKIESGALVWQGYFFDGTIVPTVGWRQDTQKSANAGNVPNRNAVDTSKDVNSPLWRVPDGPYDPVLNSDKNITFRTERGRSTSWSIVAHTPKALKDKLPFGTDFSLFYNRSDNFQPAGGRTDVFGHSITSPTGKTKDYGFTISTLNDKLLLKVNWYETSVKNANLDGGGIGSLQNVYMVGFGEHWGRMFAQWAKLGVADFQGTTNYALNTPNDPTSGLIDPTITTLAYQPMLGQTVAQAKAAQDLAINTLLANSPPADFEAAWQIAHNQDWSKGWGGYQSPSQPSTLAVTGDTFSKGVEYELTAQPTSNWNISINAAKTSAKRLNLAQSFATWVDARYKFYQGPAGDVRLWNGAVGGETVRSKFTNEFYGSYVLYRLQENADVPELRPWRFNVVSGYTFNNGWMKGINVGGAYRWQAPIVTGYPISNGNFDLGHPYKGPAESTFDMWVGYERKINRHLTWRVQVNVRNVFGSDDLIPITVEPDGTIATAKIPEPTVWTLTNTLKF